MDETARTSIYALDAPDAPAYPALSRDTETEVAIVGGGYTGLSTALHLAEAGRKVTLLEAYQPGWGASGRNGGQLNPGLKYDPSTIVGMFGKEKGKAMVDFAWSSTEQTAQLIRRLGIDCALRLNGTLRAAARGQDAAAVRRSQEDMAGFGMPVEWIGRDELAGTVGHGRYHGAFLDRRGGDLDPLRYSRGLAKAGALAGATIHGDSRALRLERDKGGWKLATAAGTLRAGRVLVCCNGYADDLVPGLRKALVPVFSSVLASAPLPPELAATILPGRQVLYESGLVTVYYRVDERNRLVIGGRGPMRPIDSPATLGPVARHAFALWPALAETGWQTAWNGRVAVTTDHMPHVHEIAPGLVAAYGYNGRGVALASALGRPLAAFLAGEIAAAELPIPPSGMQPIRFHRFWPLGVHATIAWSRFRNALAR